MGLLLLKQLGLAVLLLLLMMMMMMMPPCVSGCDASMRFSGLSVSNLARTGSSASSSSGASNSMELRSARRWIGRLRGGRDAAAATTSTGHLAVADGDAAERSTEATNVGFVDEEDEDQDESDERLHKSFLEKAYRCPEEGVDYCVRQVPGDGGCLFHALTMSLNHYCTNSHADFDAGLREVSGKLRHLAVRVLRANQTLVLEDQEVIPGAKLLKVVAEHYNTTTERYCEDMLRAKTWGGGPEIVAISNHLRRPVYVYEVERARRTFTPWRRLLQAAVGGGWSSSASTSSPSARALERGSSSSSSSSYSSGKSTARAATSAKRRHHPHDSDFIFRACARFGSPAFDGQAPLRILCADGRFPNVRPADLEPDRPGDHFLVLHEVPRPMTAGAGVDQSIELAEGEEAVWPLSPAQLWAKIEASDV